MEYYVENKNEFSGELGHEILVQKLIEHVNTFDTPTIGIDVGANVGKELSSLHKICNEKERFLLAFEPNPMNVPLLTKAAGVFEGTRVFPYAISDKEGVLPFYTYGTHENCEGYELGGLRAGGQEIARVPVKRLDDILKEYPDYPIKYIKIDTEGNDTLVLRGLQENLHRVHYIVFEASDCLKDSRGPGEQNPLERCVQMLDAQGFIVYRIGSKRLLPISGEFWHPIYDRLLMWSNCFAVKKDNKVMEKIIDDKGYYLHFSQPPLRL